MNYYEVKMAHPEQQYLDLLRTLVTKGEKRQGRNGLVRSTFAHRLQFDVAQFGFPLLTTKRVFWRGVVTELLWFLRGQTDANLLKDQGVHIWDGNSSVAFLKERKLDYPEGECGPIYGHQIRCFGGDPKTKKGGRDQLKDVVDQLINDPNSRRIIISMWNPLQNDNMCIPPCHVLYQFFLGSDGLSCQLLCRSQDVACGTPFNIASAALLTTIFAHIIKVKVDRIILVTGDTHLYEQHVEGASVQMERQPHQFPSVKILREAPAQSNIDDIIAWIESLTPDDIQLQDYVCHAPIKYDMVA